MNAICQIDMNFRRCVEWEKLKLRDESRSFSGVCLESVMLPRFMSPEHLVHDGRLLIFFLKKRENMHNDSSGRFLI